MGGLIRANHPDLKGSFTCLGNWYNLFNEQSMVDCKQMIDRASYGDARIGTQEIVNAEVVAIEWERDLSLWWLYKRANAQGDWATTF